MRWRERGLGRRTKGAVAGSKPHAGQSLIDLIAGKRREAEMGKDIAGNNSDP
jgi:hypothetical protein